MRETRSFFDEAEVLCLGADTLPTSMHPNCCLSLYSINEDLDASSQNSIKSIPLGCIATRVATLEEMRHLDLNTKPEHLPIREITEKLKLLTCLGYSIVTCLLKTSSGDLFPEEFNPAWRGVYYKGYYGFLDEKTNTMSRFIRFDANEKLRAETVSPIRYILDQERVVEDTKIKVFSSLHPCEFEMFLRMGEQEIEDYLCRHRDFELFIQLARMKQAMDAASKGIISWLHFADFIKLKAYENMSISQFDMNRSDYQQELISMGRIEKRIPGEMIAHLTLSSCHIVEQRSKRSETNPCAEIPL